MNRFYFFTILFLFINSAVVAQTPQTTASQSAPNQCGQFRTVVIKPDNTIDYKLRVGKPDETIEYKGRVINPCDQKRLVSAAPLPTKPLLNKIGQSPIRENQNQFTADSRLKPITEILTSSEMLKRARLVKEQKEKESK